MSGCGCKGMGGFGLDVPTAGGVLTADPCAPGGDPRVVLPMAEQMLADLGFYKGPIGPNLTPDAALQFAAAATAYGQSKGFDATTPPATKCAAIVADWQALQAKKTTERNVLIGGGVAALALGAYLVFRRKR